MQMSDIERSKKIAERQRFSQQLIGNAANFVRGSAQASAFATFGFLPALGVASGFVALSYLMNRVGFSAQKENTVNAYRDELSLYFGKNRDAVSYEDYTMAASRSDGFGEMLRRDSAIISSNERVIQIKSFLKNVTICAAVIGFTAMAGASVATGVMGYSIITAMALAISEVGEKVMSGWQKRQSTTGAAISQSVQNTILQGKIIPEKLLEFAVSANPSLSSAIEKTYHQSYYAMPMVKRAEVVSALADKLDFSKLAADVNEGKVRPSEVPWLLLGKNSLSTSASSYSRVSMHPHANAPEQTVAEDVVLKPKTLVSDVAYNGDKVVSAGISRAIH